MGASSVCPLSTHTVMGWKDRAAHTPGLVLVLYYQSGDLAFRSRKALGNLSLARAGGRNPPQEMWSSGGKAPESLKVAAESAAGQRLKGQAKNQS